MWKLISNLKKTPSLNGRDSIKGQCVLVSIMTSLKVTVHAHTNIDISMLGLFLQKLTSNAFKDCNHNDGVAILWTIFQQKDHFPTKIKAKLWQLCPSYFPTGVFRRITPSSTYENFIENIEASSYLSSLPRDLNPNVQNATSLIYFQDLFAQFFFQLSYLFTRSDRPP